MEKILLLTAAIFRGDYRSPNKQDKPTVLRVLNQSSKLSGVFSEAGDVEKLCVTGVQPVPECCGENSNNIARSLPAQDKGAECFFNVHEPNAPEVKSFVAQLSNTATNKSSANPSPFSPGLIAVLVPDPSCVAHTHQLMMHLTSEKGIVCGIPATKGERVFSLYSGNERQTEQAKIFQAAFHQTAGRIPHQCKYLVTSETMAWLSNEGVHALLPHIEAAKNCWLIVELVIAGQTTPAISQWLIRISAAAKQAGSLIILIVSCAGSFKSQFRQVCDDYLEVSRCEPDVGVDMAFLIDCPCISELGLEIGKMMCSIQFSDGIFQYRFTPFISFSLEKRIIWALRCQGKTLEEIGRILKVNKSTVLRRLQGLPPLRRIDESEIWLSKYLETTAINLP